MCVCTHACKDNFWYNFKLNKLVSAQKILIMLESFFTYLSHTQQVCMLLLTQKKIVYHVHKILKNRKIEKCDIICIFELRV